MTSTEETSEGAARSRTGRRAWMTWPRTFTTSTLRGLATIRDSCLRLVSLLITLADLIASLAANLAGGIWIGAQAAAAGG